MRRLALLAAVFAAAVVLILVESKPARPAVRPAKPHVVCAVVAFLIVGPSSSPVAVLAQRVLGFVPCPAKQAAARAPAA